MTHVIDAKRLGGVLKQARQEKWNKPVPAHIPTSLMLAINSLKSSDPLFWEKDAAHLITLLERNTGVQKIFAQTSDLLLAFAIRQARM